MQHNHSSIDLISSSGWQTMGELELTVEIGADHAIGKWLAIILGRLDLRADFLGKVLRSAQETVSRAMQVESDRKFEHLHLLIFIPSDFMQNSSNWGFYRLEKVEIAAGRTNPDHTIEFYLYQD